MRLIRLKDKNKTLVNIANIISFYSAERFSYERGFVTRHLFLKCIDGEYIVIDEDGEMAKKLESLFPYTVEL